MSGTEDLLVWQRARSLVKLCYQLTSRFPRSELLGLTSQLRRAAVSVAANIAEGHGRRYPKEFLHFISNAQSSLREVEAYLVLSQDLEFGRPEDRAPALALTNETGRMLTGLDRGVRRRLKPNA